MEVAATGSWILIFAKAFLLFSWWSPVMVWWYIKKEPIDGLAIIIWVWLSYVIVTLK